ncbi:MAG: diacylglycerol kinase [Phototrophicales bacterium]|nr:MAG: diacylglycerol kinase [Phototrophicales bacterium]
MRRWLHPDILKTLSIDPTQYSYQVSTDRTASYRYALAGLLHMLRYSKNVRIQAVATVLVMLLCIAVQLPLRDVAIIVLVTGLVWFAEFVNAAIEALINLVSPTYHDMAKVSKDIAAGAVLLCVIVSIIVGLLVIGPPLLVRLGLSA